MAGPQKATKIARQIVDLPGVNVLCFVFLLHGIIHIYNRDIPAGGIGFF